MIYRGTWLALLQFIGAFPAGSGFMIFGGNAFDGSRHREIWWYSRTAQKLVGVNAGKNSEEHHGIF